MSAWQPERAVQLIAGTPPGGGLDRVARALAKAITEARLLDVPVEVVNVPGDGARRAWTQVIDKHAGDAHVVGISSPNLVTDYLVGIATFEHGKYTPIATLVTEYIAFAVSAGSDLKSGGDMLARLRDNAKGVTVALSTALGNPNHIALAKLTKQVGGDVNAPVIRVFDTALDCVADVIAGRSDVCAVTAASVIAELNAGRLRVLAITAPAPARRAVCRRADLERAGRRLRDRRLARRQRAERPFGGASEILGRRRHRRHAAAVLAGGPRALELVADAADRRALARLPRQRTRGIRRGAGRVGAAQGRRLIARLSLFRSLREEMPDRPRNDMLGAEHAASTSVTEMTSPYLLALRMRRLHALGRRRYAKMAGARRFCRRAPLNISAGL